MQNFSQKINSPYSLFHKRTIAGALLSGALLLSGCGLTPSELKKIRPPSLPRPKVAPLAEGESPRITVIAGGTESYWKQAQLGAEAAGKKFGARIEWKVPSADLVKSQKKLVEAAMKTSQGLVLAPVDPTKMMQPVGDAARAGLSVVPYDRDVFTNQNKLTFVHNDDYQTGVLAAQQVQKFLTQSDETLVFEALPERPVQERVRGFEATLQEQRPDVRVVKISSSAQKTKSSAAFIPSENVTAKEVALITSGLKSIVYGASEALARSQQRGEITIVISPDYYNMGFQSVKAIMDFRATKQMPPREMKIAPRVLAKTPTPPANRSIP